MDFHSAKTFLRALSPARHPAITQLAAGAAALLACASLHAQTVPVQQFGLTAVNSQRQCALQRDRDAEHAGQYRRVDHRDARCSIPMRRAQGSFFAVARVPNSVTSAMDLIVADAEHGRILRYPGPGPASYAVSTPIFTWSHPGSGPRVSDRPVVGRRRQCFCRFPKACPST